jgi:hypothetical protein
MLREAFISSNCSANQNIPLFFLLSGYRYHIGLPRYGFRTKIRLISDYDILNLLIFLSKSRYNGIQFTRKKPDEIIEENLGIPEKLKMYRRYGKGDPEPEYCFLIFFPALKIFSSKVAKLAFS